MSITWSDVIRKCKQKIIPEIQKGDEEWRTKLSEDEFRVTRMKGTEAPFSGQLCYSHEAGKYACRCCGEQLFDSTLKFESGTGWPSFTEPVADVIKYRKDSTHGMIRVEVMCSKCDAHLGHVFPDGPEPTGLRYCINSISLVKV